MPYDLRLIDKIKFLAEQHYDSVVANRRFIHQNPELSFVEYQTSDFVSKKLDELGIPNYKMANTGVIGILEGKNPGKTIALRADLDALPIDEQNEVEYKSKNKGIMHACGHDVHSASLLGAAEILKELKDEWNGTIKLIFQPGEEKLPGGASILIKEGVLENPSPETIIAQHVFPSLETGKVGFLHGSYMASCDEIYLTVKGKGGHAALSGQSSVVSGQTIVNPLLTASEILLALQNTFMRKSSNEIPTVLAFGKMLANGATNVIPDEVKIEGTFRTMNEEWRTKAHTYIIETINTITNKTGGGCDIRIEKGYPVLVNNEDTTARARQAAEQYLGKENVITLEKRMTSEDFAYYSLVKPVCFYRLGTGNIPKGITSGVHTSTFNIDEKALLTATGLLAWIAIQEVFNSHQKS